MTEESIPQVSPQAVPAPDAAFLFMRLWAQSLAQVLGQISGSPLMVDCLPEVPPEAPARGETDLQFLVTADGGLQGEMALRIPPAVALTMAQLFLGETPDAKAEFKTDHREAVEELLRQVAGHAASALKPHWGEVQLRPQVAPAPAWPPSATGWIGPTGDVPARIVVEWQLNAALTAALTAVAPSSESQPKIAGESGSPVPEPAAGIGGIEQAAPQPGAGIVEGNLDLLLEVELAVMLRFGERSMLLREILELGAGSVVELDRGVDEPVDLMLEGRVIARGEVVVVDGNYGLRVLEVQPPPLAG
jgi:flagellar motor switch protein FliN